MSAVACMSTCIVTPYSLHTLVGGGGAETQFMVEAAPCTPYNTCRTGSGSLFRPPSFASAVAAVKSLQGNTSQSDPPADLQLSSRRAREFGSVVPALPSGFPQRPENRGPQQKSVLRSALNPQRPTSPATSLTSIPTFQILWARAASEPGMQVSDSLIGQLGASEAIKAPSLSQSEPALHLPTAGKLRQQGFDHHMRIRSTEYIPL